MQGAHPAGSDHNHTLLLLPASQPGAPTTTSCCCRPAAAIVLCLMELVGVVHQVGEGLALPLDLLTAIVRHEDRCVFVCSCCQLRDAVLSVSVCEAAGCLLQLSCCLYWYNYVIEWYDECVTTQTEPSTAGNPEAGGQLPPLEQYGPIACNHASRTPLPCPNPACHHPCCTT